MRDLMRFVGSKFGWNWFAVLALMGCIGCSAATTQTEGEVDFDGIRETDRGFEAIAAVSIDTTESATRIAFSLLEIAETGIDTTDDAKRDIEGNSEERGAIVTVVLETRAAGGTHVEVRAQKGQADAEDYEGDVDVTAPPSGRAAVDPTLALRRRIEVWDKELARQVIEKIVEFTGLMDTTP